MNNSKLIILRSVFGKVGQSYIINPCIDPNTGNYPPHVKNVNKDDDMIISDKERESGNIFIKVTEPIEVSDGTVFDLTKPIDKAKWEAIKHSTFIANSIIATNKDGDSLINGNRLKYGTATLYVEIPGEDTKVKNSRRKLIIQAQNFILQSQKEDQLIKCKLLGKDMKNSYASDVEDFLMNYAEKHPEKMIDLYTGSDTELRILLMKALEKAVIRRKDNVYMYTDTIVLGVTDDAVIIWMKQPEHKDIVELIKKDSYPELYTVDKNPKK